MSPMLHMVLSTALSLFFVAIGVLVAVRARDVGKGRGMILVAALLVGLHGILGVLFQLLWTLPALSGVPSGSASLDSLAPATGPDQVILPLWQYLGPVLLTLSVLSVVVALVLAGAARRATPSSYPSQQHPGSPPHPGTPGPQPFPPEAGPPLP